MSAEKIFISGMFRSGTTLLTKLLNAHPDIVAVDDPFFQFFKVFRNKVCEQHQIHIDPNRPIDDHFHSPFQNELEWLEHSDLNIPFNPNEISILLQQLLPFIKHYCPKLEGGLASIKADLFETYFEELLKLSIKTLSHQNESIIGFKNTFCEAMGIPLLKTYENLHLIFILRDPRAVMASQNKDYGTSYPILFAIRHWRKSYACAIRAQQLYPERCTIIKYEDLISQPEFTIKKLCKETEIEFQHSMLDIQSFKNHDGQAWKQNSSYGTSNKFNSNFVDRWKEELNTQQIQMIENLCGPEMIELNYLDQLPSAMESFPTFDIGIQNWIKPYLSRYELNSYNFELETKRISFINNIQSLSAKEQKQFFLYEDINWQQKAFSNSILK